MSRFGREYVIALGAAEVAQREAAARENDRVFTARADARLAPQGYRLANGEEPGVHFAWLAIDDREIDGGRCQVWVVKL